EGIDLAVRGYKARYWTRAGSRRDEAGAVCISIAPGRGSRMIAFLLRRLFQAAIVMLTVALISFVLFNYVGDPINAMVGQDTSLQDREKLRQDLGLNDPIPVRFARFVGGAAQGRFGLSYRTAEPVGRMILERLPATLELSLVAALFALLVGVPMGVYSGLRPTSWVSRILHAVSLVGISLPTFLIGIILIL